MEEYKGVKIKSKYEKYSGFQFSMMWQFFLIFGSMILGNFVGKSLGVHFLSLILIFVFPVITYLILKHTTGAVDSVNAGATGYLDVSDRLLKKEQAELNKQENYKEYKNRYEYALSYLRMKNNYLEILEKFNLLKLNDEDKRLLKLSSDDLWSYAVRHEKIRTPYIQDLMDKYNSDELNKMDNDIRLKYMVLQNEYCDIHNEYINKINSWNDSEQNVEKPTEPDYKSLLQNYV